MCQKICIHNFLSFIPVATAEYFFMQVSRHHEKICIIQNEWSLCAEACEMHSGRSVYSWLHLFMFARPQLATHGVYSTTGDCDIGDVHDMRRLLLLSLRTARLAIVESAIYRQCLVLEGSVTACAIHIIRCGARELTSKIMYTVCSTLPHRESWKVVCGSSYQQCACYRDSTVLPFSRSNLIPMHGTML